MRILLSTPSVGGIVDGNWVTVRRWSNILTRLGHRCRVARGYRDWPCDLLIVLHALKSRSTILRFRRLRPELRVVLCLSGTDIYGDQSQSPELLDSIRLADRLVVLQPLALEELSSRFHAKTSVIYQSVKAREETSRRPSDCFQVAVIANLRVLKAPFSPAHAAHLLPAESRIRIRHVGVPLDQECFRLLAEQESHQRWEWLGRLPHQQAMELIADSHLVCIPSQVEGGSNVLVEALSLGTPVVASAIPGLQGTLGKDYPGLFTLGDDSRLAAMLRRAEKDSAFYQSLEEWCRRLRPLTDPQRESDAWAGLLAEIELPA